MRPRRLAPIEPLTCRFDIMLSMLVLKSPTVLHISKEKETKKT